MSKKDNTTEKSERREKNCTHTNKLMYILFSILVGIFKTLFTNSRWTTIFHRNYFSETKKTKQVVIFLDFLTTIPVYCSFGKLLWFSDSSITSLFTTSFLLNQSSALKSTLHGSAFHLLNSFPFILEKGVFYYLLFPFNDF